MPGSARSPLLICAFLMTGVSVSIYTGQEFITAFLQSSNPSDSNLQLLITAFNAQTSVTVSVNNRGTTWSLKLGDGQSQTVTLPKDVEIIGSGLSYSSILINSSNDISVTALSSKAQTSSRMLVLPVDQLDNEYYIVTPSEESVRTLKEFAVINYNLPSNVHIYVNNWVIYEGINYTSKHSLTISLKPFQVFQLQSDKDLSGTRVFSRNQIAVLSGHTCTGKNNHCGHVSEQLIPVSSWGIEYYASPVPYQYRADTVYIMASQKTQVGYISRINNGTSMMHKGNVLILRVRHNSPVAISSNIPIQVLFYCTGGSTGNIKFDPFFVKLPDISMYCNKYQIRGLQDFLNAVLITAKTTSIADIKFNKLSLQNIQWKHISGTDYSWALYRYGRQAKSNIVSSSSSMFSVLSLGTSNADSYGLPGICPMRKSSCTDKKCRKKESCQLIKGKPVCLPDSEAICQIWGDAHYQTFDGFNYDFQGTCTYTVTKTCMRAEDDPTLPEFYIEAKYDNRASRQSSYISMVSVLVEEYTVTMVQSEIGFARVNNIRRPLPILLDDGIVSITTIGFHALLETSFISIRYDWNTLLSINIPSSYYENVCGLCGNYNGKTTDDMEMPQGTQGSNLVEFGRSWKVNNYSASCCDDCCGVCNPILPDAGQQYKHTQLCGIISQDLGPFHVCHKTVDPDIFLKNCVNDMDKSGGYKKDFCEALSVYALRCQVQGIIVEAWRATVGCEIECPLNSHYNSCANPCADTCAEKPYPCDHVQPCIETCECDPGFVLHEDGCVLKTDCGNLCDGQYYPPGEIFWGNDNCTQLCACDSMTQKVTCMDYICPLGKTCAIRDGVVDCYPVNYRQCTAYGDLHYITFDNTQYDFHGTCRYQLSALCDMSGGLQNFYIEVSIRNRGVQDLTYISFVLVKVYDVDIILSREIPHKAMVNGTLFNLPFNWHLDQIQIYIHGWDTVILTKLGLRVAFDLDSRVTVTLPQTYFGSVCGLCGNYNGNKDDDMKMKNGQLTKDVSSFLSSWRTAEGCKEHELDPCPTIKTLNKNQRKSLTDCGIILNPSGPFQNCLRLVDPETYFQNCLYDFCTNYARQDVYCKVIEAYVIACQQANAAVTEWRSNKFCNAQCPLNSSYELCSKGCAKTCSHWRSPYFCHDGCRESCICQDGFLLDGDRCVPLSHCGCVYHGIYYQTNDIFYPTSTCNRKCVCQPGGLVKCSLFSCRNNESCTLQDGVRKCHPTQLTVCTVAGTSLYHTFDGLSYNFQGDCTYILTKTCSEEKGSSLKFAVYLSQTAPKKVIVIVNHIKIVLTQGRIGSIQVDDVLFNLPCSLKDNGVLVIQNGINIVLSARFGLEIIYDVDSQVIIDISSDYHGTVCGLCGNYNGNATDDYQLPSGLQQTNLIALSGAWKDNSSAIGCLGKCQNDLCPTCPQSAVYAGNSYCGALLVKDGPFSACHSRVNPQEYFSNCVTELCLGSGNQKVLCSSLQNYVTMCQSAGITGIRWRSNNFCSMDCPQRSIYRLCADTCTNACARIAAPIACPILCSEGCQCDDSSYNDKDKCVPLDKCGCYINGKYYMLNESFLKDNCTHSCTCQLGNVVQCVAYTCPAPTLCKLGPDTSFTCEKKK